ncbi:uncharacterized protein EV420DRAFT_1478608 [Desarmillaria tabescens]|uniref:Uncharacterized protein n=1 Tax=Armillaria tabescens TaxID=1929756 RepID=A0AA39KFC7_ARMTA|nr:uncharacterized protein EV420DRAFT_1478608 [Desarmillaria tabescens]KAK0460075.1 hypothetical protein EV420DRAFT_1478608 [Desarmillaria tabescens]
MCSYGSRFGRSKTQCARHYDSRKSKGGLEVQKLLVKQIYLDASTSMAKPKGDLISVFKQSPAGDGRTRHFSGKLGKRSSLLFSMHQWFACLPHLHDRRSESGASAWRKSNILHCDEYLLLSRQYWPHIEIDDNLFVPLRSPDIRLSRILQLLHPPHIIGKYYSLGIRAAEEGHKVTVEREGCARPTPNLVLVQKSFHLEASGVLRFYSLWV